MSWGICGSRVSGCLKHGFSDFAQRPAARKSTFDELLNIDAYEESWSTLKGVPDQIKAERGQVREEIRELTGKCRVSLRNEKTEHD